MKKLSDIIDEDIKNYTVEYRVHATRRMFQRDIQEEDVEAVLRYGDIIEEYGHDFPLPSLLISGMTFEGSVIHIVAGINDIEKIIVIITTYHPDPFKWSETFDRRIK